MASDSRPNRPVPTGREINLGNDDFIVTKTDPQSRIIYANRLFMRISGYSESELLGQPQNIVRHPDMPKGVFRHLWQTIQKGEECFAYINNLAKNGDNYWVLANITPELNERGEITGYFSCRRQPRASAIEKIKSIYDEMLTLENKVPAGSDAAARSLALLNSMIDKEQTTYEAFILAL
jgi:PAS domain S-box-containing protein